MSSLVEHFEAIEKTSKALKDGMTVSLKALTEIQTTGDLRASKVAQEAIREIRKTMPVWLLSALVGNSHKAMFLGEEPEVSGVL